MPEPPSWLSEEAREVWATLDPAAVARADGDALVVYCCAVADYRRSQRVLDETGTIVKGDRGLVRNPLLAVRAEASATMRALAPVIGTSGRFELPGEPARFRNQAATERTIASLRLTGRLEEADAGAIALARHLARSLDVTDPAQFPAQTASLARAHLKALGALRGTDDDARTGTNIDVLLAQLSTPVGDTEES